MRGRGRRRRDEDGGEDEGDNYGDAADGGAHADGDDEVGAAAHDDVLLRW